MKQFNLIVFSFLLISTIAFSSCSGDEASFTPGIIAVVITGAFVVGVIFYFLLRPQNKRKGDNNRKP
ncbi:MAG: hypothetical protein M3512_11730 [Bacteroidota bacterium]|nr:hypothetical protein [Bacteroidota bacterium]